MATIAFESQVGHIEDKPYERGMAYQQVIDKRREVKARGYEPRISFRTDENAITHLVVEFASTTGLEVAKLNASVKRPSDGTLDTMCELRLQSSVSFECQLERVYQGLYLVTINFDEWGEYSEQVMLR
jgi:nitrogen fixation protein FixH